MKLFYIFFDGKYVSSQVLKKQLLWCRAEFPPWEKGESFNQTSEKNWPQIFLINFFKNKFLFLFQVTRNVKRNLWFKVRIWKSHHPCLCNENLGLLTAQPSVCLIDEVWALDHGLGHIGQLRFFCQINDFRLQSGNCPYTFKWAKV